MISLKSSAKGHWVCQWPCWGTDHVLVVSSGVWQCASQDVGKFKLLLCACYTWLALLT
jgi:hypothetical protein